MGGGGKEGSTERERERERETQTERAPLHVRNVCLPVCGGGWVGGCTATDYHYNCCLCSGQKKPEQFTYTILKVCLLPRNMYMYMYKEEGRRVVCMYKEEGRRVGRREIGGYTCS